MLYVVKDYGHQRHVYITSHLFSDIAKLVSLVIQLYGCTIGVGSNTEYIMCTDFPLLDLCVKQGSR